jgi:rhomboid protease GluP
VGVLVEIYRSPHARSVRHRALVLASQEIPFVQGRADGLHTILVDESWVSAAVRELERYENENRGFGRKLPLPPAAPAWRVGGVLFALVLVAVAVLEHVGAGGFDWHSRGLALAAAIRAGETWRCLTALTLHADPAHLMANLVFGLAFGSLVAHGHGGGLGWLAVLVTGGLGNWANAWLLSPQHASLGASTAVFGAVGILCGSEARRRHLLRDTPLRQAAPVTVALVLFAYLGMGEGQPGRGVDLTAHLFGLVFGLALGPLLPSLLARGFLRPRVQLAAGAIALGLVAAAWARALT